MDAAALRARSKPSEGAATPTTAAAPAGAAKKKKKPASSSSSAVTRAKWVLGAVIAIFMISAVAHNVLGIVLVPRMRNGELFAVGYYGARLFTTCHGIGQGEGDAPVLVIHHGAFQSCQHYVALQQRLWESHQQPSCCIERSGFGYSPTPDIASAKADLMYEVRELLQALEQAVDSRRFIHLGHGVGATYAWQASHVARATTQGLVLLDGIMAQHLQQCPAVREYFTRTAAALHAPAAQWLQRLGVRRWLAMARGYADVLLPSTPPDAVERHKQLALTDGVYFATATALAVAPALMQQVKQTASTVRAAYVASNVEASQRELVPPCVMDIGADTLRRFFKTSTVINSRVSHSRLAEDVEDVHKAIRFVLDAK